MNKVVISVLGEDRPGIVHRVSKILAEQSCNILEVSQTILQSEFAGIFIASMPEGLGKASLEAALTEDLSQSGIIAAVKEFKEGMSGSAPEAEPYVITLSGQDRLGIIPNISAVIAGFEVNIENLKAITQKEDPSQVVIVFEVAVPKTVHRTAFREAVKWKAEELGLDLSVQHRDIFEAIHRV
ncbi:MAG: ACT domain-containing protein [Deltaproteobacteria bacterium]|nr:ACT domain-containing protein [Deltaproteobacteria bacterium]